MLTRMTRPERNHITAEAEASSAPRSVLPHSGPADSSGPATPETGCEWWNHRCLPASGINLHIATRVVGSHATGSVVSAKPRVTVAISPWETVSPVMEKASFV
jgi:hypothetical protein